MFFYMITANYIFIKINHVIIESEDIYKRLVQNLHSIKKYRNLKQNAIYRYLVFPNEDTCTRLFKDDNLQA